ncbi:tRNA pseudouridine synthase 1, partial [Kappamyces sp. JEL0680]
AEENKRYEDLYLNARLMKQEKKLRTEEAGKEGQRMPGLVKRAPKKKVALMMSYCGTGYAGMQINNNVATIELDLHKALAASGAVSQENAMDPSKSQFMRCARTDKGVHAGGQVVSLKMMLPEGVIESINAILPPQIRVWGYAKVKNSFDSKNLCDSRIYEYLLPTYCLDLASPAAYPYSGIGNGVDLPTDVDLSTVPRPTAQELEKRKDFGIQPAALDDFKAILKKYVGSKNYHNFTVGKHFNDKSSQRYIKSIEVGDPFRKEGIEWVSIKIHGQSFMLHQIRKMVGLA